MANSLWLDTAYAREAFPTITQSLHCDICIIGGGLSGLANAYFLAKEGKDVVLLEKGSIGNGATGHSTGKLTVQHDVIFYKLMQKFGHEAAKLYYTINQDAVLTGKTLASNDAWQETNSVLFAQTKQGAQLLADEQDAYKALGIEGFSNELTELPISTTATLTIKDQLQLHPVRFGQQLAEKAKKVGARIYEDADVLSINLANNRVSLRSSHQITFKQLIICTHYPIEAIRGLQVMKLTVDRSYIVAAHATMPLHGQYLSVDSPKRSIRTAVIDGEPYLLLSGEQHRAGVKSDTYREYDTLYDEIKQKYRLNGITHGWSAQDPQTPDWIPYAGAITKSLPHIFICTGFRKWGLSHSLATAKIIRDAIIGKQNRAIDLYSPSRTGFGTFLYEALLNTGFLLKEFTSGHLSRLQAPICTHLGCRTRWNEGDQTWDCACHGSRFRRDGTVMEGPATKPLDLK